MSCMMHVCDEAKTSPGEGLPVTYVIATIKPLACLSNQRRFTPRVLSGETLSSTTSDVLMT